MKILLVSHTFIPKYVGGTEVYTHDLAQELKKKHEVAVITTDPLSIHNIKKIVHSKVNGLDVYTLRKNILLQRTFEKTYNDKDTLKPFLSFVEKFRPDIIHYQHIMHLAADIIEDVHKLGIPQVFTVNDFWLQTLLFNRITSENKLMSEYEDLAAARDLAKLYAHGFFYESLSNNPNPAASWSLSVKQGLKKAVNKLIHSMILTLESKYYLNEIMNRSSIMKKNMSFLDVMIFPTLFLFQEFCKWDFSTKRVLISSHGINDQPFEKFKRKPSDKIRFGFVGSIIPSKGLDVLLKAWNKIDSRNATLKIYGSLETDKNYAKTIKKLAAEVNNVELLGTFDPSEIATVYSGIDVLVVPSRWFENAPLVIRNALLTKTPVIATRLGSLPELVQDTKNGFLFNNEDSEDLAEKITTVINDPDIITGMKRHFKIQKTIKENAEELINLYSDIIKLYE